MSTQSVYIFFEIAVVVLEILEYDPRSEWGPQKPDALAVPSRLGRQQPEAAVVQGQRF